MSCSKRSNTRERRALSNASASSAGMTYLYVDIRRGGWQHQMVLVVHKCESVRVRVCVCVTVCVRENDCVCVCSNAIRAVRRGNKGNTDKGQKHGQRTVHSQQWQGRTRKGENSTSTGQGTARTPRTTSWWRPRACSSPTQSCCPQCATQRLQTSFRSLQREAWYKP